MKLSDLCSCLKEHEAYHFAEKEMCGITQDSREVKNNYVFVAIKGHKADGHDFVMNAVESGAGALVLEKRVEAVARIPQFIVPNTRRALALLSGRFYGNPSEKMSVIGITGTNGKTTTSFFTKSIIEASGNGAGMIGTIQYQIGKRIIPARETTPESVEIQRYLSEMLQAGITYAVIEASSHALSQHRLDGVRFSSAVFTNLSAEHLDYHDTINNYRAEKLKLVKGLSAGAHTILNADHNTSKHFAACTKSHVVWYGIKRKRADVKAEITHSDADATKFLIHSPWGGAEICLRLTGIHNVYNALAAAASGLAMGFPIDTVKAGLEALHGVPGRLEKIDCGQDFPIYIDFAHTHQALQIILSAVREVVEGRILLVFGCGGDRDRKKRPKMGHIAEKYSDLFWVTSDNPRSEDPNAIVQDILKGVKGKGNYHVQPDRKIAIEEAVSEAKRGDAVVIAGKGHEKYQISKNTIVPFDDRDVVRKALRQHMVASV